MPLIVSAHGAREGRSKKGMVSLICDVTDCVRSPKMAVNCPHDTSRSHMPALGVIIAAAEPILPIMDDEPATLSAAPEPAAMPAASPPADPFLPSSAARRVASFAMSPPIWAWPAACSPTAPERPLFVSFLASRAASSEQMARYLRIAGFAGSRSASLGFRPCLSKNER